MGTLVPFRCVHFMIDVKCRKRSSIISNSLCPNRLDRTIRLFWNSRNMHFGSICPNKTYSMFIVGVRGKNKTPLRVSWKAGVNLNMCYFVSTQNQLSITSGPVCLQTAWEHLNEKGPVTIQSLTHHHILNSLGVLDTVLREGDIPRYVIIQLPPFIW